MFFVALITIGASFSSFATDLNNPQQETNDSISIVITEADYVEGDGCTVTVEGQTESGDQVSITVHAKNCKKALKKATNALEAIENT